MGVRDAVRSWWFDQGEAAPLSFGQGLTAAAAGIDLGERSPRITKPQIWQKRAWDMFDSVGEVKYASYYVGNSMSKLMLYAGVRPEPDEDPIPVSDAVVAKLIPQQAADAAEAALERVRSPLGGFSEILRPLAINLMVPGECYFLGLGPTDGQEESWQVRSIDEVKRARDGRSLMLVDDPEQKAGSGRRLEAGRDLISRIWVKHPRWAMRADSSLNGVLEQCEELLDLGMAARAIIRSRIAFSGILKVPNGLTMGTQDPTQNQGAQAGRLDPFLENLLLHMTAPIKNLNDASSVVPMFVRGELEALKGLEQVSLDRPFDEQFEARTIRALRRLAQGLNVPVEVVLGMEDVNHWTAWQISEDAWKAHIEPGAQQSVEALTSAFFRPVLDAAGLDPQTASQIVLWYDPSNLIVRPMTTSDVLGSVDRAVIGGSAARRKLGFDESDAPTAEEIQVLQSLKAPGLIAVPASGGEGGDQGPPPAEEPAEEPPPGASNRASDIGERMVAAAASEGDQVVEGLGHALASLDRSLRDRLAVGADASMRRALDRAGARLSSKVKSKKNAAMRASIATVAQHEAASVLGPTLVASLGFTEDTLLQGSFDELEGRFLAWCEQTSDAALGHVPGLEGDQLEDYQRRFADLRADAWTWFRQALIDVARERLYDPSPAAPEEGEYDGSLTVPFSIIRQAAARAGGSHSAEGPVTAGLMERLQMVFGLADGWLSRKALGEEAGIVPARYQWAYGAYPRTRPFQPHAQLDGLEFDSFTDSRLRNPDSWPPEEFYSPGDHDGCVCDVETEFIKQARAA